MKLDKNEQSATMITNYLLHKTIGQGTFSKVKLATHIPTNEQVAIKIIQKNKITSENDKIRLTRELKIMRKVRHPHIAQLYQIIQNNQHIYLVTQYCPRGQLFDHILSQEKLPQFQASKFLIQLMSAIQYIHTLGITHRDLKPQNLLLDEKYNIKLIDFGLSNVYSEGEELSTACGSPCYAAPEMVKGHKYKGLQVDIWSSGIILFAMCFGYLPYDDPVTSVLYQKIQKGDYEVPHYASVALKDMLSIILQVDPKNRATIKDIRQHQFCKQSPFNSNMLKYNISIDTKLGIIVGLSDIPFQKQIEEQMKKLVISCVNLKESIKNNKHNNETVSYYLLLQRTLKKNNKLMTNYYYEKNNVINRYSIIEKAKMFYEDRLKKQQRVLYQSRMKRELLKQKQQRQGITKFITTIKKKRPRYQNNTNTKDRAKSAKKTTDDIFRQTGQHFYQTPSGPQSRHHSFANKNKSKSPKKKLKNTKKIKH